MGAATLVRPAVAHTRADWLVRFWMRLVVFGAGGHTRLLMRRRLPRGQPIGGSPCAIELRQGVNKTCASRDVPAPAADTQSCRWIRRLYVADLRRGAISLPAGSHRRRKRLQSEWPESVLVVRPARSPRRSSPPALLISLLEQVAGPPALGWLGLCRHRVPGNVNPVPGG